jgi:hypothetical protein
MRLSKAERFALQILAGCPDGATSYALLINRGINGSTLYRLVELDLARAQRQELRHGDIVWRLWITEEGKAILAS